MRKIVFCYTISSTYHFALDIISLLKDNGFRITIISSQEKGLSEIASKLNVSYRIIDISRNYNFIKDIIAIIKLIIILRELKPDFVIGATPKAALLMMIASSLSNIKHRIYHIFGLPFETAIGLKKKILLFVERITGSLSTDIIPISQSISDIYIKNFPTLRHKIRNVGKLTIGGVNISKFDKEKFVPIIKTTKLEVGIPIDYLVIGFVARMTIDKGIGDFIKMWNIIKNDKEKVVALVIGSEDTRDKFNKQKILEFLNDERVYHIEWTDSVEKYFTLIDVFILPSHREGFGNVNIEASSLRIPVVSYKVSGCVDSVLDKYSGVLVEKGDIESLAAEVLSLLNSPAQRQKIGDQGRIFVTKYFTIEIVANNILNFLLNYNMY